MKRLAASLMDQSGRAEADMQFGRDRNGQAFVTGSIKAALRLQCQRCLGAMDFPVDVEFNLGVVRSLNEASRLVEDYEALILDQPMLALSDVIEDELILALPAVPMHAEQECPKGGAFTKGEGGKARSGEGKKSRKIMYNDREVSDSEDKKVNPFAVLKQLKGKSDD
jgi:uncharacterized protein